METHHTYKRISSASPAVNTRRSASRLHKRLKTWRKLPERSRGNFGLPAGTCDTSEARPFGFVPSSACSSKFCVVLALSPVNQRGRVLGSTRRPHALFWQHVSQSDCGIASKTQCLVLDFPQRGRTVLRLSCSYLVGQVTSERRAKRNKD